MYCKVCHMDNTRLAQEHMIRHARYETQVGVFFSCIGNFASDVI